MGKILYRISVLLGISHIHSMSITNNIEGVNTPHSDEYRKTALCFDGYHSKSSFTVLQGETVELNKTAIRNWHLGAALRLSGCNPTKNPYIGYLSFDVQQRQHLRLKSINQNTGFHVRYFPSENIFSNGNIQGYVAFTPIQYFPNLPKPLQQTTAWRYHGLNLHGLEAGKALDPYAVPNLAYDDVETPLSDLSEMKQFIQQGINTIRLPLRWAYLQPNGPGIGYLDRQYFYNFIQPTLETLTNAQIYTVIDLHCYMRYSPATEGYAGISPGKNVPDGTIISDQKFLTDVWLKLYKLIEADSNIDASYLLLDLVNQPVDVPQDDLYNFQVATISALRNEGFHGPVLVEGNGWSSINTWHEHQNNEVFKKDAFKNLGEVYLGVRQDFQNNQLECCSDLYSTGTTGFNLNRFAEYLKQNQLKAFVTDFSIPNNQGKVTDSCKLALNGFMQYLQNHANNETRDSGFVGWTAWGMGHGMKNAPLRITPESEQAQILSIWNKAKL